MCLMHENGCINFAMQSWCTFLYFPAKGAAKSMYVRQLTQNEIKQKRLWLKEMASGCKSGSSREKAPQSVKRSFDFSSPVGAQIYASFSDQELLDILHRCGKRLGYSPSQKEVFWIYRAYIRQRFGNWPKALRQAGLCVSTGRGDLTDERLRQKKRERERLLQSVRTRAKEFGRVPHPRDAPELVSEGVKYFYTWFGLLYAANVVPSQIVYIIDDLEPEYVQMLAEVQELHEKLGHPPNCGFRS